MEGIIIIGTSHIAQESINRVQTTIETVRPKIVALELDAQRFYTLTHRVRTNTVSWHAIRRIGIKGLLFALFGAWASRRLGRLVGVEPGDEMKAAIKAARSVKATIALIDQDIAITLARFSRQFTWRERGRLVTDFFRGLFFRTRELERYGLGTLDLSKVPSEKLIRSLLTVMERRYPSLYRVLVTERNKVMAAALVVLHTKYPESSIVAVVGAGHVEGITKLIDRAAKPQYLNTV